MSPIISIAIWATLLSTITSLTFPYENMQLDPAEALSFPSIAFGNATIPIPQQPSCKSYPGEPTWPSEADWSRLNTTLNGRLLKPQPLGAVCAPSHPAYNSNRCNTLVRSLSGTRTLLDDPLNVLTVYLEGDTCPISTSSRKPCTQGGFPVYVVNASTVAHVQAAVNFARNRNIRLIVKNTGHDFGGRSAGAGALSIWTHHLKSATYLANYTADSSLYTGKAVHLGAGLEAWELSDIMVDHRISLAAPGWATVGAVGGWMLGGGHGHVTSTLGLGADQPLSLSVVTADGRFVTADATHNADLFWALRGSGVGPAFGVVTSAVVRAYEPLSLVRVSLQWLTGPSYDPGNSPSPVVDRETFWRGVSAYYRFGIAVGDAGGVDFGYIRNRGNGSFSFDTGLTFPNKSPREVFNLLAPLYANLQSAGVNIANRLPAASSPYATRRGGTGASLGNARYSSRLWPRSLWASDEGFAAAMAAVRSSVEDGGYTFHGLLMAARPLGGDAADSVSPGWRAAAMHASMQDDTALADLSPEAWRAANERVLRYSAAIRAATPGGGAYINEGDSLEPGWQDNFYGLGSYARLLRVKAALDPWDVFWAPTAVGSEGWEVRTEDGTLTQNGRLCRVGS
ncbi:hypothetical protein MCOR07_008123 [Pyricularia oryzae]|nr:hypothetical protein MCOR30_010438 [Pyricularia oryzae]KAI6389275.1 hypothetical protein MCOR23_010241 [Pyricularia oryzae]KAI6429117.1 hypothetical protein MCOR22_010356 [Pyricularia oryzae]KAI6498780.1 hypothetical protein MCOR11_003762 [Pyricularia oryzae]KAI6513405.1 hypothetical protein MCOR10_009224 [Pyricularia oryzae]